MHYSHGFNHFHIHPLYHHHYLQSPRQSYYHNLLVLTWVHLKTTGIQCLCTFYCIYTQSAPSRLAGQTSCQIIVVHLLSSIHVPLGCWYPFFGSKIFSIHFLIIGPHSMKHNGTLNLQGGRWPESTSPFLVLNIWYLKSFTSQRAVCEAITTIFVS